MPVERKCPTCMRDYVAGATLCVNPTCNALDPPSPAALIAGTLVPSATDEYTILDVLGWGGMATTYLAANRAGQNMAVKEMLPSGNTKVQQKLEFMWEREARIQQRLGQKLLANPPAFPPFPVGHGWFQAHGRHLMAMEFMPGEDLDRIQNRVGMMPPLRVVQHGIEICMILRDHLHSYEEAGIVKAIIHRDIKPANIHILNAGGTACLLDFGISRFEAFSAATMGAGGRGGTKAGTPAFAAPELLQRGKPIFPSSDLYCLCASLWALIANAKEFPDTRADQIAEIRNFVRDPELQAVLIKGTDENPNGRYQTAEELRTELVRIYEVHQPLPAHLQPVAVVAPVTPATPGLATVATTKAPRVKIVWENTRAVMLANGNEYQRDLAGRVYHRHRIRSNTPLVGVNVIVADIIDSGGGHPTGVSRLLTDANGYFHLDQIDSRVPVNVTERRLRIVVEETTGRRIHDETVKIKRPRSARVRQPRFQGLRGWISNVLTQLDPAGTAVALAIVCLAATMVLAVVHKWTGWNFWLYTWPHTFVGAIVALLYAGKLRKWTFRQAIPRAYLANLLLILWVMSWLGWVLGPS